jgi:tetratricopeptide (TPR) repeat protein
MNMDPASTHSLYHERMLQLHVQELPLSELTLGLDSLGVDHWPAWQELVAALPQEREPMVALANDLLVRERIGESLALYQRLERLHPEDPGIGHNLGALLLRVGEWKQAMAMFRRVLDLDPSRGETAVPLAHLLATTDPASAHQLVLAHRDDPSQTFDVERLELRIRLAQDPAEADRLPLEWLEALCDGHQQRLVALVTLLLEHGSQVVASQLLKRLQEVTTESQGLLLKAMFLLRFPTSDQQELEAVLEALQCRHGEDGEVLLFLSQLARRNNTFDKALAFARTAVERDSHPVEARLEAGCNLFSLGRRRDAFTLFEQCIALDSGNTEARKVLAFLHYSLGEYEASRLSMLRTLRLLPRAGADAWCTCAHFLRLVGDLDGALKAAEQVLTVDTSDVLGRNARALMLLQQGRYTEAWADYEYRTRLGNSGIISPQGLERWDGARELDDLVLVSEQGVGDLVQFLRYVPFLQFTIPRVSILVHQRVRGLMELAGVFSAVHVFGEPVPLWGEAAWLPILSIPGLLGITPECVLIDQPYLAAPEPAKQRWAQTLRSGLAPGERLIGLHWQGYPGTGETTSLAGRSFPLSLLEPLADFPHLQFVSLQKGSGSEQMASCAFTDRFVAAQPEVDACWDYVETTGMIAACDRVITSDSGVAHLAGALGCSVWLLLPHVPDWRWGLEGSSSPWYATMRIFRQPRPGDWAAVIRDVRQALLEEQERS